MALLSWDLILLPGVGTRDGMAVCTALSSESMGEERPAGWEEKEEEAGFWWNKAHHRPGAAGGMCPEPILATSICFGGRTAGRFR